MPMFGITGEQLIRMGKTKPQVPFLFYTPVACAFMAVGIDGGLAPSTLALLFLAGALTWTPYEYLMHRFSFHYDLKKARINFLAASIHQYHHKLPAHMDYVAAPTIFGLPGYLATFAVTGWAIGSFPIAGAFFAGFGAGYLFYEWVHYMAHHGKPKFGPWKYLKKHHMVHHFADHDNYFGVSSPAWDYVFGTHPVPLEQAGRKSGATPSSHIPKPERATT
jgi:sterol desaturase/sphingolipid hydroxylase (fatty acid hydroxylase superfamily)